MTPPSICLPFLPISFKQTKSDLFSKGERQTHTEKEPPQEISENLKDFGLGTDLLTSGVITKITHRNLMLSFLF